VADDPGRLGQDRGQQARIDPEQVDNVDLAARQRELDQARPVRSWV